MKRFMLASKKFLSFLLTFIILFSLLSGIMEVHAAAVTDIVFERIKIIKPIDEPGSDVKEGDRLVIYGSGFVDPIVQAGESGSYPLTVNTELSKPNKLIIDNVFQLNQIKGLENYIRVYNNDGADNLTGVSGIYYDLRVIPSLQSLSNNKAYVGNPLTINGTMFEQLSEANDTIRIAGTSYTLDKDEDSDNLTADIVNDGKIEIDMLKSPIETGLSDVKIVRKLGGSSSYRIETMLVNSIMVVNELTGLTFDRIDPNSGPKEKPNTLNIYFSAGGSNLTPNMRVFVQSVDAQNNIKELEGTNLGIIQSGGTNIGLKVRLSEAWSDTGIVDIVLTTPDRGSELVLKNKFTYLDVGNTLSIDDPNGIIPNFKKETEQKNSIISGRNIGYFSALSYDKVIDAVYVGEIIGYQKYRDFPELSNTDSYKIKYTATYDQDGDGKEFTDPAVTIIREIWVTVGGEAKIQENPANKYTLGTDKLMIKPGDPNLVPNEPKKVDVIIKTTTTIFSEVDSDTMIEYYTRSEEASLIGGYTYYPDETSPSFDINNITPRYGPNDREIYMTIKGTDFEVKEDGSEPTVTIGGRLIAEDSGTLAQEIMVFDDNNKIVDGKIITRGTKIKFRLPIKNDGAAGGVNVTVTNPSGGQFTVYNGFEFRNPNRPNMPEITGLKEAYTDIRGGVVSGETVLITGVNFDTSANEAPRIIVTIDGENAIVIGKVSSDGKTVTIIPPPGTVPGDTQLQLINDDGSMYSIKFTYKLITSNPKITSIVPIKGGSGTKLIIKGEDFVLPDKTVLYDDPKMKGSVVILGGIELNAYKYSILGETTNVPYGGGSSTNIYYEGQYDPDGNPLTINSYDLNGHMVDVQDITTIYVDIPDKFYSFKADAPSYLKWTQVPLGSLKVEVLNPDGAKSKEDIRFNYMNPATSPNISSISPNSGSVDGGTVVTIIGSDFRQDDLEVYFGSELSEDVQFINSGMLRALVPEYPYTLPAGKDELVVPVMVINYDGGGAVYYDKDTEMGFKYRVPGSHPIITSITTSTGSSTGSAAGGDSITLNGQDFRRSPDMSPAGIPKVYFNGREALVKWKDSTKFSVGNLEVITPPSMVSGPVDIVLVNYDSGTCTYKGFSYTKSKPGITSVMPNSLNKKGDINVQINGSLFRKMSTTGLFASSVEKVGRHLGVGSNAAAAIDTIVAFGDESTGDQKEINTINGNGYTVMSELRFDVTVTTAVYEQATVKISLASDNTHTVLPRWHADTDDDPDSDPDSDLAAEADIIVGSSHLFIINHKMDLGSTESYDEGILVETTPSTVTITRRIAPYAKALMQVKEDTNEYNRVDVKSPPIDSIGQRNLSVINEDRGTAVSPITIMNPDSSPVINKIDPKNKARKISDNQIEDYNPNTENLYSEFFTFVPLEGGAFLTISGADFRRNVKAYLNDVPLEIVSKSINDDQLVIKIPKGTNADIEKDYRIVVVNEDGGSYDSTMMAKPHYIRYIAPGSNNPVISTITPDRSSSRGTDNWIHITGSGFNNLVKVLIDGEECRTERAGEGDHDDVNLPNYLNIYALVPPGLTPGKKTVQVQNTDYGFAEVKDGLTIISSPGINRILDDKGIELNPLVLSVEGGENIKLEGLQFYEGAQVIFGGVIKAKSELVDGENGIPCLNINNAEMVVIGGTSVSAKLEADGSITCTTPKLSVGTTSVLVINSDNGVSNIISGSYQKPMPDTPGGMNLEAVDGDTLKLEWSKIEDIAYYEIYLSTSDDGKVSLNGYQYLGSVVPTEISNKRLRYYIDGLSPSTWYSIKLKSVNLFGGSDLSSATLYKQTKEHVKVTYFETGSGTIGGINQSDTYIVNGASVIYHIGEKSVKDNTNLSVNFEQPAYLTTNSRTVSASLRLIMKYPDNKVKINDRDVELNLKLSNMNVAEAAAVPSAVQPDSAVRVSINKSLGARGDEVRIKLQRGYRIIVNPFSIDLGLQVKNENSRIKSFNGDIGMILKYAESKKALYPGGVYVAYYDSVSKRVDIVNTQNLTGKAQSSISKAGEYVLVGKLIK